MDRREYAEYISKVQRLQRHYEIHGDDYYLLATPVVENRVREDMRVLVGVVDSIDDAMQWVAYARVPLESLTLRSRRHGPRA